MRKRFHRQASACKHDWCRYRYSWWGNTVAVLCQNTHHVWPGSRNGVSLQNSWTLAAHTWGSREGCSRRQTGREVTPDAASEKVTAQFCEPTLAIFVSFSAGPKMKLCMLWWWPMRRKRKRQKREKAKKDEQPHHRIASLWSSLGKNCYQLPERTQDKIQKVSSP